MLASQYIYTACGKDRTGAFSIFSKSKDVTDVESAEIREMMMYKIPSGLPYEPTEQEIEELFPKKFGYFILSSGRACLANVCYVGRVYSKLDCRVGNYIIHAFVFEKNNDFAPYGFIEHDLFKRKLTMKEWHDDPIPDELPKNNIPENGGMLSNSELSSFFNEDRKNKLKLLIEAIINSSSENPVCLCDNPKSLKYWFKALSVCLPKTTQNSVSFCTHFTNTLIPGNISSRVQIRVNQPESGMFNYMQEAQRGHYVFDFQRNIVTKSVKPGKYTESIVKLLFVGIFEAVKFADNINKIVSAYDVSINEASDLMNLNNAEYSAFGSANELFNAVMLTDRVDYETQSVANNLLTQMSQFNFIAQQKLSIYAFIYKNISAIDRRIEIIKNVIDNAKQCDICTDGAKAFRNDIKSKASFILANYLDYLKAEGLAEYIERNLDSFPKLFMAFDFLVNLPTVRNSFQRQNNNASEESITVKNIMVSAFRRQSISDLDLLMDSANLCINGLGVELLSTIVSNGDRIENIPFAFDILTRLYSKTDVAFTYLLNLVKTNVKQEEFVKAYILAQKHNQKFYSEFENKHWREPVMVDFSKTKDMFSFANQELSSEMLKKFFNNYYVTGKDTAGLFLKRLDVYLFNNIPTDKRVRECVHIIDILELPKNTTDKKILPPIYRVIIEAIFSVPYAEIVDVCVGQDWKKITNIIDANAGNNLKQETHELILITRCGNNLREYHLLDTNSVLTFFKDAQKNTLLTEHFNAIRSSDSLNIFIEYYFSHIANILIIGPTLAGQIDYDDILKKVFGKIIEQGDMDKITSHIIKAIKNTKCNKNMFISYILKKHLLNSNNKFDKRLGDVAYAYFESLSSGARKKIFAELLSMVKISQPDAKKFERFFDEFNKKHKTGLFDLFKRKIYKD